ncbi:MFS transporter [Aliiroseovarius subalbicans]|uniref:MFS transporter n=1 Tax=Aliiroseovarius subalbicans TaxID=2925840 RepID=UPI001F5ACF3A|nr:MFS transporter [Aliiroseovarius subalbicans]MCI2399435.1 MFS transporter [Aliiroseovarius subalbicans]
MRIGIFFLVIAYVLSQFYRAFLAVMTPVLSTDLGATAEHLSRASGLWFIIFAAMQIPVGWALDHLGPRRVAAVLLALGGGGGAAVFAMATTPGHVQIAMMLIGVGCSPVLMASYYIFARMYAPAVFATLAGAVIGIGALGNIAGSLPMAWAVEVLGWRETMWGLAAVTLIVALAIFFAVQDPPSAHGEGAPKGSVLDLLKMPALWPIFALMFVNYTAPAGLRGLWAGPFLKDVYGMDASGIGVVTLVMGLSMVIGNFAYGPLDRVFKTRKWVIFVGNMAAVACVFLLWLAPEASAVRTTLLLAAIGLFGSSFPMIVAHSRSFFPPHLVGRGVTLVNMFGIGGVGIFQFASANVFTAAQAGAVSSASAYQTVFLFFAIPTLIGCLVYLFSQDRLD